MRDRPNVRRVIPWLATLACAVLPLAILPAFACNDSAAPGGTGDRLVDDTHPQPSSSGTTPPPPADAGAADGMYAYDAHSYKVPDGYSPTAICKQCACPSGTQFCFGGATGQTQLASCPADLDASAIKVGCNTLPAKCAAMPTCECILSTIAGGQYPCYPVCADYGTTFELYCPNP